MAAPAKWHEQIATCPYCAQSVAEIRDGKTYFIGTLIRLVSAVTLGCWHPNCDNVFRLEPRRTLPGVSLQKAKNAFSIDNAHEAALELPR